LNLNCLRWILNGLRWILNGLRWNLTGLILILKWGVYAQIIPTATTATTARRVGTIAMGRAAPSLAGCERKERQRATGGKSMATL